MVESCGNIARSCNLDFFLLHTFELFSHSECCVFAKTLHRDMD